MEVPIAARPSSVLLALGRFLIAATLLGALALSVALQPGIASAWWIELLRYTPYPLLLAPPVLALVVSALLGWGWRLAALASLLAVALPVMGFAWGQAETGSTPLRLMTYNIKSYRAHDRPDGYAPTADEIRRQAPDVLVMQDANLLIHPRHPMPEEMARTLADLKLAHWHYQGQYAIASRHPLRNCRMRPLAPDGDGDYLRCTLLVDGQPVDLVTVHFLSPRDGLNAARHQRLRGLDEWRANFDLRMAQSRQLAEDLATERPRGPDGRPMPLIVAGDLNAPEASPVIQGLLALGLRDVWSSAAIGYGYTHGHSLRPHIDLLRIDHILVGSQIAVARAEVGGHEGSEHRPVIADLRLSRERP